MEILFLLRERWRRVKAFFDILSSFDICTIRVRQITLAVLSRKRSFTRKQVSSPDMDVRKGSPPTPEGNLQKGIPKGWNPLGHNFKTPTAQDVPSVEASQKG